MLVDSYGWTAAQAYELDPITDNSEDEKHMYSKGQKTSKIYFGRESQNKESQGRGPEKKFSNKQWSKAL